jgi:hypothetical protein
VDFTSYNVVHAANNTVTAGLGQGEPATRVVVAPELDLTACSATGISAQTAPARLLLVCPPPQGGSLAHVIRRTRTAVSAALIGAAGRTVLASSAPAAADDGLVLCTGSVTVDSSLPLGAPFQQTWQSVAEDLGAAGGGS